MKKGLGKGLGALIKDDTVKDIGFLKDTVMEIDINKIEPDATQPRKSFDTTALSELANSIENIGVISPIIVKKKGDFYEIISGERRFKACKLLKLKKIPALVREYTELEKVEVALIENIQREDLNPIEEALAYKKLQDVFSLSHEKIAEKVGKNRATISNSIRLLKLDERVQYFLIELKLSQGHARALLIIEDKDLQFEIAEKIIEESLNVRQVEELTKNILENSKEENNKNYEDDKDTDDLKKQFYETISKKLDEILGTKVTIKDKKNKGKIEIEYYSEEDLDRLICLLNKIKI